MREVKWIALHNVLVVALFAALAIFFEKWWIVLFALLAMGSSKDNNGGKE